MKEHISHIAEGAQTVARVGITASVLCGGAAEAVTAHEYSPISPSTELAITNPFPTAAEHYGLKLNENTRNSELLAVGPTGNQYFDTVWSKSDAAVADGQVSRTWMWGPEARTQIIEEPYAEAPGGKRQVVYFDKSRMEITNPNGDPNSEWYVTNGLLVMEMVQGRIQVGNNEYNYTKPAEVNIVGDLDDPNGVTYASLHGTGATPEKSLLKPVPKLVEGTQVTAQLNRAGDVSYPQNTPAEVTIASFDDTTGHNVAGPFWEFMNTSGYDNPFYATGRPATEPYWVNAKVGGTEKEVLMQCFERRCLTYDPSNPEGWQVEAGNVGMQYREWRYGNENPNPEPEPEVCDVKDIPFPKEMGDQSKGILLKNEGCDIGVVINDDPENNMQDLIDFRNSFAPNDSFEFIFTDDSAEVPIDEDAHYDQTMYWGRDIPGAENGKVARIQEDGKWKLYLSLPTNITSEDQKNGLSSSVTHQALVFMLIKDDLNGEWGADVGKFILEQAYEPEQNGKFNFTLKVVQ